MRLYTGPTVDIETTGPAINTIIAATMLATGTVDTVEGTGGYGGHAGGGHRGEGYDGGGDEVEVEAVASPTVHHKPEEGCCAGIS